MQHGSPERKLWGWYRSLYPLTQIVLGCMVVLIVFFACSLCVGVAPAFVQGVERGFHGSYAPPGNVATPPAP